MLCDREFIPTVIRTKLCKCLKDWKVRWSLWIALASVVLWACRNEDSGQLQSQIEEEPITEEDLELIKERETNIRQLEVRIGVIDLQSKEPPYSIQL